MKTLAALLGLRLSIAIDPAVADQTTSRLLELIIQNSSGAAIRFKPFSSLHLSGGSEDNTFWAPADLTIVEVRLPQARVSETSCWTADSLVGARGVKDLQFPS